MQKKIVKRYGNYERKMNSGKIWKIQKKIVN